METKLIEKETNTDLKLIEPTNEKMTEERPLPKSVTRNHERRTVMLSIEESDKEKLVQLDNWSIRATEMTILERNGADYIQPKRGELWTLDFGMNVGSEIEKIRPCIVVSSNPFNSKSALTTVIPITRARYSHNTQFQISNDVLEYPCGIEGVAKAEQIGTKSKARLGRKIGELNESGLSQLESALKNHLFIH